MDQLSNLTGVAEPTLRLLSSLLSAYPLAILTHSLLLHPSVPRSARLALIIASSLLVHMFFLSFTTAIMHSLSVVLGTWAVAKLSDRLPKLLPKRVVSTLLVAAIFGHLMWGYFVTRRAAGDVYVISWTMTQCVLSLRAAGTVLDWGESKAAFSSFPVFVAYCYFYGYSFVGPQVPLADFEAYISLEKFQRHGFLKPATAGAKTKPLPPVAGYALQSLAIGVVFLGIHVGGGKYLSSDTMRQPVFLTWSLASRIVYVMAFVKVLLCKYLGVWALVDGAVALSGLSFGGLDSDHKPIWDSYRNCNPLTFHLATSLSVIIPNFNMSTNDWCKTYIFKRLRFLGSKDLSSALTLLFLAAWHGPSPGYYLCFGLEFLDIYCERVFFKWVAVPQGPVWRVVSNVFGWLWASFALGYATVAFEALRWDYTVTVWNSLYWSGHIVIAVIIIADLVASALFRKPKSAKPEKAKKA
ncbi:MBOAT, membrane-bound O-acyltransferase family-domain-containing protein [Polychytrium aggregatum]|uniref:MBOAT, membrane-bound O-acyltransferase family-domain-containing protein n=1 Tax=Polychytrium aggregatum TaxID=110093 RepID=UPI0022FDEEB7|nr:MBOAT, membrane-bound O-acyltransferase family-domain-containing protein [Polychytrium aggregatum]KAI9199837.1 MBOAT, membrane-bound O-acyltransferase family-domain-containing protein [Polychytrium aggregatum]